MTKDEIPLPPLPKPPPYYDDVKAEKNEKLPDTELFKRMVRDAAEMREKQQQ